MPELPEVETVKRGLNNFLPGLRIASVDFDWSKSFPNSPEDVKKFVINAQIVRVRRRAKVLMIDLSTKYSLVIHLKMTGQLVFVKQKLGMGNSKWQIGKQTPTTNYHSPGPSDAERWGGGHPNDSLVGKLPDKSTRVIIAFKDGERLFFNDQRKFGWMRLIPTDEIPSIDFMKKVGPEPLESDFKAQDFIDRLMKRKNSNIKAALLDQTVIAGVGNIYADESLFAAKIHPASIIGKIPKNRLKILYEELRKILELSIEKGGSTDRNYVDAEGKKGSYLKFARVFRLQNKPCPDCGNTIEKIKIAGRGTHICPKCQKKYGVKK